MTHGFYIYYEEKISTNLSEISSFRNRNRLKLEEHQHNNSLGLIKLVIDWIKGDNLWKLNHTKWVVLETGFINSLQKKWKAKISNTEQWNIKEIWDGLSPPVECHERSEYVQRSICSTISSVIIIILVHSMWYSVPKCSGNEQSLPWNCFILKTWWEEVENHKHVHG